MRQKQLGHSDLFVSELGFGCMSLSEDDSSNKKMLHEAIEQGINFFDTADLYQFGFNEETVGKALKGKRNEVILASKGGNEWGEGINGWQWNPSKKYIKEALKRSLLRLNIDYLDLYQLHGGTIDDPLDETIEAFDELVKEGTIRYYGISSIRPNVIRHFVENSNIVSVMMQYSLLDRRPEEWFDFLQKNNTSIIARGPVAKGLLTDQYQQKLNEKGYLDYQESELRQLLPKLQNIASESTLTLQQLSLRYIMDQSVVASAIAGASKPFQLIDNTSSSSISSFPTETMQRLKHHTKASTYDNHR